MDLSRVIKIALVVIIAFIVLPGNALLAQLAGVKGCIENYKDGQVVIQTFHGSSFSLVDTLFTDSDGCFIYSHGSRATGQVRLLFDRRQFLDFFVEESQIEFTADFNNLLGTIAITGENDNSVYYDYLKYRANNKYKQASFESLLADTLEPAFREEVSKELKQLHEQELGFVNQLALEKPGSLVSRVISLDMVPLVPDSITVGNTVGNTRAYVYKHFLDKLDFSDTTLLRTNAISAKLISYLSLTVSGAKDYKESVLAMQESAYYLLYSSMANEAMFNFIKDYLVKGFTVLGFKDLTSELGLITYPCCFCDPVTAGKQDVSFKAGDRFPRVAMLAGEEYKLPVKKEGSIVVLASAGCYASDKLVAEVEKMKGDTKTFVIYTDSSNVINGKRGRTITGKIAARSSGQLPSTRPLVFILDRKGKILFETSSWLDLNYSIQPEVSTSTR